MRYSSIANRVSSTRCCADKEIRRIASFENEGRFIALDLLYGVPMRADIYAYLIDHGMTRQEYEWFMTQDVTRRSILGVDYYEWNEKLINTEGKRCVGPGVAGRDQLVAFWRQQIRWLLMLRSVVSWATTGRNSTSRKRLKQEAWVSASRFTSSVFHWKM